jgi:DNA ligase (NAD+)
MDAIAQLAAQLEAYNAAYRSGAPLVDDATYDRMVEQLRLLDPRHPILKTVEPEKFPGRAEVRHPNPMLSTDKAYTDAQLERFVARVQKEANTTGPPTVLFRVTPKLDGLAGRDDGTVFVSRGNGFVGYDITDAFAKGVVPMGGRGQGLGEIVVVQSYFAEHLADKFEHPRNMVVGIVSSDTLNVDAQQALDDGMVRFVPYSQLPDWQGDGLALLREIELIIQALGRDIDYPMDGVVVEVINQELKARMGATAHHYRWQIAVKRKGQTAVTQVENIQWQVGRTGNVTPVLEVTPVPLSGATIRRVTAHHAGMLTKLGIGPGARIEVIRSGEVIPKMERVLEAVAQVTLPQACPACGLELSWKGDFLRCSHVNCPAQTEQRISHWFRTLGNADWFGIKSIKRIVAGGFDSLEKIYAMTTADFSAMGFGPGQSANLAEALRISRTKSVEDWRFLAALGIADLGVGDSRKLLQHYSLEELSDLDAQRLVGISGFGEITSRSITQGLAEVKSTLSHLLSLGFNLERTQQDAGMAAYVGPLAGKNLVFTGKMQRGSREAMQAEARRLGANVQSAVSGTTHYLICGEKVGASKRQKAAQLGVHMLSEDEYYQIVKP